MVDNLPLKPSPLGIAAWPNTAPSRVNKISVPCSQHPAVIASELSRRTATGKSLRDAARRATVKRHVLFVNQ